jgi:hypothetical protein
MSLSNFDKLKAMFEFYEQFENLKVFEIEGEYRCLLYNMSGRIYIGKDFYSIVVVNKEVDFKNLQYEDSVGYMTFNSLFELRDCEFEDYEVFYEVFDEAYNIYKEDSAIENERNKKKIEGIKKFMGEDFLDD